MDVASAPRLKPDGAKAPAAASAIEINGLSLRFETADGPVEALCDINLTIARGEFVSFIGPSGCGKTTLLRAVADLETPTGGSIRVNGMSPREARSIAPMATCFRRRRFIHGARSPAISRCRSKSWASAKRSARRASPRDSTSSTSPASADKFPWQLSGGMQQRASIARALSFDPDLLLMDEPFGALDEIVRDMLNQQLLRLWEVTGKTVLFVTHSIPEAVFLSTRIVVMSPRPGRIYDVIECNFPRDRSSRFVRRRVPRVANRVRHGLREGHSYDG